MDEKLIRVYITITSGMRGYFAVLIGVYKYPDGYISHEPIQSGCGSYINRDDAIPEATSWSKSDEIPLEI